MDRKLLAIIVAIFVFAICVAIIAFFDIKSNLTLFIGAALTIGTYKGIASSGTPNNNKEDHEK